MRRTKNYNLAISPSYSHNLSIIAIEIIHEHVVTGYSVVSLSTERSL